MLCVPPGWAGADGERRQWQTGSARRTDGGRRRGGWGGGQATVQSSRPYPPPILRILIPISTRSNPKSKSTQSNPPTNQFNQPISRQTNKHTETVVGPFRRRHRSGEWGGRGGGIPLGLSVCRLFMIEAN